MIFPTGISRSQPEKTKGFLIVLVSFLLSGELFGQVFPPQITTFDPKEYKGHHQVYCAEPLDDGRIVFGAGSDLLIYNGEEFKKFNPGGGMDIFGVDQGPSGRIYVGGTSLMGWVGPDRTGELTFHSLKSLLPDSLQNFGMIVNTVCDEEGNVYFNAFDHLFYYTGDTIKVLRPEGPRFFFLHSFSGQYVIEDIGKGFYSLENGEKELLPGTRSLSKDHEPFGFQEDLADEANDGGWVAFSQSSGLIEYDPRSGDFSKVGNTRGEKVGEAMRVLEDVGIYTAAKLDSTRNPYRASYVVGTDRDGVYLLKADGRIAVHIGRKEGMPVEAIWKVVPDGSGNIWVTTNNGIALLRTGSPFTVAKEGLHFKGGVNHLARLGVSGGDQDPFFCATVQNGWVWNAQERSFDKMEGPEDEWFEMEEGMGMDGRSMLIAAVPNIGVGSLYPIPRNGSYEASFQKKVGEEAYSIEVLPEEVLGEESGSGQILLSGGSTGIHLFRITTHADTAWPMVFALEDPPGVVRSIGWDTSGVGKDSLRIWGGLRVNGLVEVVVDKALTGYEISHYDTSHGVPTGEVWVFQDPMDKETLFGCIDGLYSFEGNGLRPDNRYGPMFSDGSRQVFLLEKGKDGTYWVDDAKGSHIKHLIPKGNGFRVDSAIFRGLDIGAFRAILPEDGRTFLGADGGLACYHDGFETPRYEAWSAYLTKVIGGSDSLLFGGYFGEQAITKNGDTVLLPSDSQSRSMEPVLTYSMNQVKFHFASYFPHRQEEISYSYRLLGFDTSWSKWTRETNKEYTNLTEGDYVFSLKARNVFYQESQPVRFRFRILPPWYRTWSAYGGFSIAGVGFLWFLFWLNSRRLIAQKRRLERTVEARTQEIREKNLELEAANEEIQNEKQKVEEQKMETEAQKKDLEIAHRELSDAHEKLSLSHREITDSINYAQRIQNALLHSRDLDDPSIPGHFILFKPQSVVSGDFYWMARKGGYIYFAAVDCTGHGVPGAFMSMLGVSFLNDIIAEDEVKTPGKILTQLRERVVEELKGSKDAEGAKDGMDGVILRTPLEGPSERKKVQFAGANNPLYIIRSNIDAGWIENTLKGWRNGEEDHHSQDLVKPFRKSRDGIEIKGDKMAVGYEPGVDTPFRTVEVELEGDEMLYIFSDGYADQFGGPKGKKFQYGNFKKLLVEMKDLPLEEQKAVLAKRLEEWMKETDQEQIDDVLVMGIQLKG